MAINDAEIKESLRKQDAGIYSKAQQLKKDLDQIEQLSRARVIQDLVAFLTMEKPEKESQESYKSNRSFSAKMIKKGEYIVKFKDEPHVT